VRLVGGSEVPYLSPVEPTNKLQETLADLQRQLASASSGDAETRARLAQTLRALADRLSAHEAGLTTPADEGLRDQLRAAARRFDVDHPSLATTLESLVDVLARMGI